MMKAFAFLLLPTVQVFSSLGTTTAAVNLRSYPSAESQTLWKIPVATEMEILGQDGDFYKVVLATQATGYIASKYVSINTPTPVQNPHAERKVTLKEKLSLFGILTYLFFGLITGLLMVRPYLIRWYKSQAWLVSGAGPVDIFFKQIGMRVSFEFFIAGIALLAGSMAGWIYVIVRMLKGKSRTQELAIPQ